MSWPMPAFRLRLAQFLVVWLKGAELLELYHSKSDEVKPREPNICIQRIAVLLVL